MKIPANSTHSNATVVEGPGDFFVSAIDGNEYFLMAGPYPEHGEAAANVERVKGIARQYDETGKTAFLAWGTCRLELDSGRTGSLNRHGLI
jgi:hypothetical protein